MSHPWLRGGGASVGFSSPVHTGLLPGTLCNLEIIHPLMSVFHAAQSHRIRDVCVLPPQILSQGSTFHPIQRTQNGVRTFIHNFPLRPPYLSTETKAENRAAEKNAKQPQIASKWQRSQSSHDLSVSWNMAGDLPWIFTSQITDVALIHTGLKSQTSSTISTNYRRSPRNIRRLRIVLMKQMIQRR